MLPLAYDEDEFLTMLAADGCTCTRQPMEVASSSRSHVKVQVFIVERGGVSIPFRVRIDDQPLYDIAIAPVVRKFRLGPKRYGIHPSLCEDERE